MTTTRAIANDIGAAPISDHSCATPSNHSGMVVFPPSGRIRRYLRPRKLLFYPTPDRELAMRLENDFILHGAPGSEGIHTWHSAALSSAPALLFRWRIDIRPQHVAGNARQLLDRQHATGRHPLPLHYRLMTNARRARQRAIAAGHLDCSRQCLSAHVDSRR